MANVCSQEEAIDIGSVFPRQVLTNTQTTEDSKEAHPEVIHLLAVLIKMIARPKTIPDTAQQWVSINFIHPAATMTPAGCKSQKETKPPDEKLSESSF